MNEEAIALSAAIQAIKSAGPTDVLDRVKEGVLLLLAQRLEKASFDPFAPLVRSAPAGADEDDYERDTED